VAHQSLSQNDIDRILSGAAVASPRVVSPGAQDAQIYDFRRPHRVSKERLRTLESMYERAVKSLEGWLIGPVRGGLEMRLQSVEQFSFGEFTLSLPMPCASYIFDLADSGGQQGVIDFGHEFAFFIVDRLFGGGGETHNPNRAMTPIERLAVRVVADKVLTLVTEVWHDHVELTAALTGFESVPEILQAANRDDPVLVANVEVSAGGASSLLLVCLPFAVLDKFFATTGTRRVSTITGSEKEREATRELTEASLRVARVPVSARLPQFRMTMAELANLQAGRVLTTGLSRDSDVHVFVGKQDRFRASAGRAGRRLAVRIYDSVQPSSNDAEIPPHLLEEV
jgi:flagellar motor switch protein FliM